MNLASKEVFVKLPWVGSRITRASRQIRGGLKTILPYDMPAMLAVSMISLSVVLEWEFICRYNTKKARIRTKSFSTDLFCCLIYNTSNRQVPSVISSSVMLKQNSVTLLSCLLYQSIALKSPRKETLPIEQSNENTEPRNSGHKQWLFYFFYCPSAAVLTTIWLYR